MLTDEEKAIMLKQRDQIAESINRFTGNLHVATTTLMISSVAFAVFVKEATEASLLTPLAVFAIIQFFILLILYIMGIVIASNNDRQYIAAIDSYLRDKAGIQGLFFHGELSRRHTMGFQSLFGWVMVTTAVAASVLCGGIVLSPNVRNMVSMLGTGYVAAIIIEILGILVLIIINAVFKLVKRYGVERDCYEYLCGNWDYIKHRRKKEIVDKVEILPIDKDAV